MIGWSLFLALGNLGHHVLPPCVAARFVPAFGRIDQGDLTRKTADPGPSFIDASLSPRFSALLEKSTIDHKDPLPGDAICFASVGLVSKDHTGLIDHHCVPAECVVG